MPLAKHRPNFSELIVIAAQQRQKIDKKQRNVFDLVLQELKKKNSSSRRTINRASTIAPITEKEEVEKEVHQEERDEKIKMKHSTDSRPSSSFMTNPSEYFFSTKGKDEIVLSSYLMYSTRMNSFINAIPCKISRFLAVGIAACSLTIEASTNEYNSILYTLDIVIDIHFIFFGILKIFSWYAKAEIKRLVHRKVEYWDLIKYSGLSDTIFSTLSLSFGHSYLGQWFRLVRLLIISTVSLQQLPHIDVLVSGITIGVKSLISTWLLLTLVFFVYAAWSFVLFGKNDPAHFGSMAMSIWTLFQFSTMDNWSQVLYINMYGCDRYPSDYVPYTNTSILSIERYGSMILPVCTDPEARPILSSVIFISFILLCGFILVSLTVASVTTGINERLKDLEVEEEENSTIEHPKDAAIGSSGDGTPQDVAPPSDSEKQPPSGKSLRHESSSRLVSGHTPNRNLLTHREMLLMVLIQLWRKEELYVASTQLDLDSPTGSSPNSATHRRTHSFKAVQRTNQYLMYRIQSTCSDLISCLLAFRDLDLQAMSIHMRTLTNYPVYKYYLAAMIMSAAVIEILLLENPENQIMEILRIFQILLQIYFSFDIFFQIISHYPAWESFFINRWNQYDVLLIIITWIPILATGLSIQKYLGFLAFLSFLLLFPLPPLFSTCPSSSLSSSSSLLFPLPVLPSLSSSSHTTILIHLLPLFSIVLLRVLRILRLLRLLSWIPELNVIMRAISSSAVALFYVVLLVFLFFFHFAIAGVFLFKENDPAHFNSFFRAMVSLFQVSSLEIFPHDLLQIATLDNWSDVARTNMYGCDFYGYDTGDLEYDSQCEDPCGLGWFAAWYFALFIIFGVFVLISLFVGVIITSMELLREGIQEENEVWKKVKLMQKSHNLDDASVDNLLEIFNLVDTGQNGKLTFHELKPVLELVSVTEADQHAVFVLVDSDNSGQIDFAEFIQLVYHMGKKYQEIKAQKLRNSRKNQTKQQEPRRLSRAGEEHFAFLADRQEEIQNPPPVDSFVNIKGDSGEGKCGDERDEHPDNQEEGQHDPDPQDDGNSSCSSDCGGNLGMISPIGGRQSLYTVPS